jgi:hypothetical protein
MVINLRFYVMEETNPVITTPPKKNPFTTVTPLLKILALTLFITLPFIGYYLGWSLKNNISSIYSTCVNNSVLIKSIQYKTQNTSLVTGKVLILSITDKTMLVQFISESTKGNITQMMVWTDTNPNKEWQEFSTLLTLPVSDDVYVKYRDSENNESQIYTDVSIPPQGPPSLLP